MTTARSDTMAAEISRAALDLFATQGYDATSIRDIASTVGIKGASMYHHFTSKEDILWTLTYAALKRLAASWETARFLVNPDDPAAQLRVFVRANVAFHADHRMEANLVNSQLRSLSEAHYRRAVEMRSSYEAELTRIVTACLRTGPFMVPNIRVTVFAILQMTAAVSNWYQPDGELSVSQIAAIYEELALKMLAPES